MLPLIIPQREWFDERTQEFVTYPRCVLRLEHSLLSISAWESKWKKPFLGKDPNRTYAESLDYIRCMTINTQSDLNIYRSIDQKLMQKVKDYIDDSMTATTFGNRRAQGGGRGKREIITSELIYYWMVHYGIPIECEKWHLNRLLTLIRICEIKEAGGQKMKRSDIFANNKALNAANRARFKSRG